MKRCGFSLPLVLLGVVGFLTLALAGLSISQASRQQTETTTRQLRFHLVEQSAQADAIALLTESTTRDYFVTSLIGSQLVNSWYDQEQGAWVHQPLLSGGRRQRTTEVYYQPPVEPSSGEALRSLPSGEARAHWIELGDGARYAYWVEDLNGLLDAESLVGEGDPTLSPEEVERCERVLRQADIGYARLMGEGDASLQDFMESTRIERVLRDRIPAEARPYIAQGLAHTYELEVVPPGFDYRNVGQLRYDLNDALAPGRDRSEQVAQIASRIESIARFVPARMGGMSESYAQTLAANILDYADVDSSSTAFSGAYRGIDAFPYYTEYARRYVLSDATESGVVLQIRSFLELWNPTNLPVSGFVKVEFLSSPEHIIQYNGQDYPLPDETLYYWRGPVEIPPNGYRVIELTQDLDGDFVGEDGAYLHYELPRGGGVGLAVTAQRQQSSGNRLLLSWSPSDGDRRPHAPFQRIDGLVSGGFDIARTSLIDTMPKNASTTLHGTPLYADMTGDPRATWYCQKKDIGALNYALRSSFGGANDYQLGSTGRMNPELLYPDGAYAPLYYGRDVRGCASSPSRGMRYPGEYGYVKWDQLATSRDLEPASGKMISQVYPSPPDRSQQRALQVISNRGAFWSLGELGHVYDPAQWRTVSRPTVQGHWNPQFGDFGQALPPATLAEFGGGITLAIGSSEFDAFSQELYIESARLLDQFRTTTSPLRSLKSRINLNTAPQAVLSTLFAGLTYSDDAVRGPFSIEDPAYPDAMSSALIEARQQRPFLSLSDIALAQSSLTLDHEQRTAPIFGEPTRLPHSLSASMWSDAGREECFRRLCDLFTTKSRAYRIHLLCERALPDGHVVQSSRTLELTLHPRFLPNGHVDLSQPSQVQIHYRSYQ